MATTVKPTRDRVSRIASVRRRDPYATLLSSKGRLVNRDPVLVKYAPAEGIAIYDRILHQFAGVAGHCQAWVDHILVNQIVIKPAKASNAEDQEEANRAADRATRAWNRVKNRSIVLQKLLYGRFYGFARAEKVWRFDPVLGEWIPDLYDVPQKFWKFDDDGRDYLVTTKDRDGEEVDPNKFLHFQWGSADTKYGEADLSRVYLALWEIQQLKDLALKRIEDAESTVLVHVPKNYNPTDRAATKDSFSEHYDRVITVSTDEAKVSIDDTKSSLISSGATARPEMELIAWNMTQVQTALLGAPQTGNKQLGTGKVEETRRSVWDDKTPLGLATADQTLTAGWLDDYLDINMPGLRADLRPQFDSTTSDISEGLSGIQSQEARNIALDLIAKKITLSIAVELWSALGIPRPRAQSMGESAIAERDGLATASVDSTLPDAAAENAEQEAA